MVQLWPVALRQRGRAHWLDAEYDLAKRGMLYYGWSSSDARSSEWCARAEDALSPGGVCGESRSRRRRGQQHSTQKRREAHHSSNGNRAADREAQHTTAAGKEATQHSTAQHSS